MWGRGEGKKKDEKKVPPTTTDSPMVVYVERTAPVTWKGTKVSGNLPESPFRDVFSLAELEKRVGAVAGGHEFFCKLHDQANTYKYLGRHRFSVASDPMRDGEPIGDDEETGGRGKKGVGSIQAEIEKAQSELDAAQAERARKQKELEGNEDDDGAGIDDIEALREEVTDQIVRGLDALKEIILEKNEQDRRYQQHCELLKAIKAGTEERSGGLSDLATVMSAQMEALKLIVAASSDVNRSICSILVCLFCANSVSPFEKPGKL